MAKTGRMTTTADVAHCEGHGPQSYGTIFEAAIYDTNNHICPLLFDHSVGTEREETWMPIFQAMADLDAFNVERRTYVVDQQKSINLAFRRTMEKYNLFLDWMHVRNSMAPKIRTERSQRLSLNDMALKAPSKHQCDEIKSQFGPKQHAYIDKFDASEL